MGLMRVPGKEVSVLTDIVDWVLEGASCLKN